MDYLKLYFNFIKHLIISNPIKIIFLIGAYISFNFAGTFKGSYEYIDIVSQYKDKNTYIYVVKNETNSSGYEVLSFDKEQKTKNEQLRTFDYHDANIVLYVIFGISLLCVIVGSFIDEDTEWDFNHSYQIAISSLIYCELEDDTYFYMIMGRLIDKRKDQIRYMGGKTYATSNVAREMKIFNMSDVYRLPKFSTKTQKRNNNLDKLGIN
jgi:hypothetical protein